jgi:hypothetical protein
MSVQIASLNYSAHGPQSGLALWAHQIGEGPPKKQGIKRGKKDRLLFLGAPCVGCGHATAGMWAPAAGCGVFYKMISAR